MDGWMSVTCSEQEWHRRIGGGAVRRCVSASCIATAMNCVGMDVRSGLVGGLMTRAWEFQSASWVGSEVHDVQVDGRHGDR